MFAKIFRQIFESSIAENKDTRHIFMDLLILADIDGVIDKTHEAIARITNCPIEMVREAISELEKPDPQSRSEKEDGCRLVRLDEHRDWGWQIVNYEIYREMRDEEARRAYFREKKREYRAAKSKMVTKRPKMSNGVLDCPHLSTNGDGDVEGDVEGAKQETPFILSNDSKKRDKSRPASVEEVKEFVIKELGLTDAHGVALWEHWCGNGFKNRGKKMESWKHTASNWERRGIFFPEVKLK